MEEIIILSAALAWDLVLGEPHRYIHPVVWIGQVIYLAEKPTAGWKPGLQFAYGAAVTLFLTGAFCVGSFLLLHYLKGLNTVVYIIFGAWLLKSTFSLRELWKTARRIRDYLVGNEPQQAREELRSLVSREREQLSEPEMISAVVESVSESSSDSFVAPLFYFLIFGIPGAIGYRAVNTLDSMIGYRGKYEHLGKFAARADDVLNFIPARLAAALLALAAFPARLDAGSALRTAFSQHSRTASPNAGWPMAAAAGALNVQLEKKGHYRLGAGGAELTAGTVDASLRLVVTAAAIWVIICFIVGGIRLAFAA